MGFTLFIFVSYHFFLIYKGQTTNERVKKNDEIEYYAKELKAVERFEKMFTSKTGEEVKEIDFRGEPATRQDLSDYKEECKRRKAELEKIIDKNGFFAKV